MCVNVDNDVMRSGTDLINYIDKLRVAKGMSWAELTERSGVSVSALRMCEKRNQYPGIKTLYEISLIFDTSLEKMLDIEQPDGKQELPQNVQNIIEMLLSISQDRLEEIENNIRFIYEKEMRKKDTGAEVG